MELRIASRKISRNAVFAIFIAVLTVVLLLLPTGFPTRIFPNTERRPARVLEVNNDGLIYTSAFVHQGQQICRVEILKGPFKGRETLAINSFAGRLELDKVFAPGDKALIVLDYTGDEIRHALMVDHYRVDLQGFLFLAFAALLVIFAGWTGVRALLSFLFTVLVLWKVLIPFLLKGWHPIGISLVLVVFMTVVILLLVGGFTKKSLAAILGSLSGTLLTALIAVLAGSAFKIHGAVLPYSETLLYAGFAHLNLTQILIAVVFIASAGALMDLAMDISAAVSEVVEKNPAIPTKEAVMSGINIGRNVVGTMTTTLLFAYTGGYIALLMVFMAQGTPMINILNLKYVSKEIMHTLVGSFGLITVAPLTALISGILFTKKGKSLAFEPGSIGEEEDRVWVTDPHAYDFDLHFQVPVTADLKNFSLGCSGDCLNKTSTEN